MRIFNASLLTVLMILIGVPTRAVYASENQFYVITGTPTPKSDVEFPVYLYKVDMTAKSLKLTREVVSKDKGAEVIKSYYEERLVIIETKSGSRSESEKKRDFAIINMNMPHLEKNFEISYPLTLYDIDVYLFDMPIKGLYFGIDVSQKANVKLFGKNLATMMQEELPLEAYKYVKVNGIPGGALPGDFISLKPQPDGQLLIPIGKERIVSNWTLSKNISLPENDRVVLFVNNDYMNVFSSIKTRVKVQGGGGHTPLYIYDKKNNRWQTIQFPGGSTGVRGFGPWLAGYVADQERKVADIKEERRRREDMRKTGTPASWRFKDLEIYSPGLLIIYNIQTNEKFMIETKQSDSEVLLVDGDNVFYRVNDEIYQAKIGEKKIEAGTLIVKDAVVPDIHWAFWGPQQQ